MKVTQQFCFKHESGEDIYLFKLKNSKGTEISITNYGAIITGFKIRDEDGSGNDIVLGFDNVKDYRDPAYLKQYPWFGCAVGRYANRIKNARFELDSKLYIVSKNQGEHQLHGGLEGFDKKVWKIKSYGSDKTCFLQMEYLSLYGEEGYPGNLSVSIRFELTEENELSYEYHATTDMATPVNLTHHSYFNLNKGQNTIHDHELRIFASKMLVQDKDLVATGEIADVSDTEFDFRNCRKIYETVPLDFDYDKSFVTDNGISDTPKLAAEARSSTSGILLQVYTTNPIVHFYAGKWIPLVQGKNNEHYGPFSGFCLETHNYCNAVNIPGFPNTILRPGEDYKQKTIYKIIN
ncbi:MAG TPA: aldose epimerase family protein [Chitinophagaceae bacterium]|nr:aldose epimerase family protein [Chitinophagaceae bacterium]